MIQVLKFIADLGISKISLRQEDIESILDTLIFDGKVSLSETIAHSGYKIKALSTHGNFNFAIWRQRDKEMFFCKKIANLKKCPAFFSNIF